jgi:hypothetical protein
MRIWSTGLGERELVLDFAKSKLAREEGKVLVRGTIEEPVQWNFEITLDKDDVVGLLHVMATTAVIRHFVRNVTGIFKFVWNKFIMRRMGGKGVSIEKSKAA